jgi:methionyl-tRNA synthetase
VLLSPVLPAATGKLWRALGADEKLGAVTEQPLRQAGEWGQLAPGAPVSAMEALFPRIEQEVGAGVTR